MEINFDILLKALAVIIQAVIAAVLVPWIKSKVDEKKIEKLRLWVDYAVEAAEQIYSENNAGVDKKAYVLEFLANKGIKADAETIDMLIEAAVYTLPKTLMAMPEHVPEAPVAEEPFEEDNE